MYQCTNVPMFVSVSFCE